MQTPLEKLAEQAKDRHKENRQFLNRIKKKPPKDLDFLMQELHEEEFSHTDCLQCANCCKTTGPLFTDKDVTRIARFLKMKPASFEKEYLRRDEDNDLVLKTVPCAFLGSDNYCNIYEVRPKACREYPHTDRKKFYQINDLTLKNVAICPAAFNIVEKMKMRLK